jgi:hydroxypyruvate isomerase
VVAELWARSQANISLLFTELPFNERPAAAAAAGFDAIECWWPFASAQPVARRVERFVDSVRDADVQLVGLNFFAGDMAGGDRGIASHPARRQEFDDAVDTAIEIGARLGVSTFNALYGNRLPGVSAQQQDDCGVSALASAAERADRIGAAVVVEPVSGVESYPLKRAEDALAIIDRAHRQKARGQLNLLADLYYLIVNGDEVAEVIACHCAQIGHVQIADAPGRHEPGTGSAPLFELVNALDSAGYRGRIGLEYIPAGDTITGLSWLHRVLPSFGNQGDRSAVAQ